VIEQLALRALAVRGNPAALLKKSSAVAGVSAGAEASTA
jgi:hypothetical protein